MFTLLHFVELVVEDVQFLVVVVQLTIDDLELLC
jgi:hypothetical protein